MRRLPALSSFRLGTVVANVDKFPPTSCCMFKVIVKCLLMFLTSLSILLFHLFNLFIRVHPFFRLYLPTNFSSLFYYLNLVVITVCFRFTRGSEKYEVYFSRSVNYHYLKKKKSLIIRYQLFF